MRLMRFLDKEDKKIKYCTVENESNFLIDGDIFSNYKIVTVLDLIQKSQKDLFAYPNFGRKCFNEIQRKNNRFRS